MLNLRKFKIRTQLIVLLTAVITLFLVSTLVSWLALNRAKVEFTHFLRSERKFDGIDALVNQLKHDVDHARSLLVAD